MNMFNSGKVYQGSSLGTVPKKIFIDGVAYQGSSQACVLDFTPPTFSGITDLISGSLGQLRAIWGAATDSTLPVRYEVYIQANTSIGLFNLSNLICITDKLQYDIFTLPNGTLLLDGVTYHVGVKSIDGVNNRDNNTVSISLASVGISPGGTDYEIGGSFSLDSTNKLTASFWISKDEEILSSSERIGNASYFIYDRSGNLVSGMTETGIEPDSKGIYNITPVTPPLTFDLNHYVVKVVVEADDVPRTNYLSISGSIPKYKPHAVFSINALNQLQATFWVTSNDVVKNTGLGVANFSVYDSEGNAIAGLSQSGISPDVNGRYKITPLNASILSDLTHYTVKIGIISDGVERVAYKGFSLLGA
jgi:hypothetical protein